MDPSQFERPAPNEWRIQPQAGMHVPGVIFADELLIRAMDDKVHEQVCNVARLPGIVKASFAMPDAHWGYGFAIGGVAAFDADEGGVVSAGGVGFDISCGVRAVLTGLPRAQVDARKTELANSLFATIPVGMGSTGGIRLDPAPMDDMLAGGARWAVDRGYGIGGDLERIEEGGRMAGARPDYVSDKAKKRQRDEMGTLGSGNHYLEVQEIAEIYDGDAAASFGLNQGECIVATHCGSRGLGHQVGTDFLQEMVAKASAHGLTLPDRELACAPIQSELGQRYLGAMRAAINCALANRQIITHLSRQVFAEIYPDASLKLLFDVSHNTCKAESHVVDHERRELFVHRKGATRALAPGHLDLPADIRASGQPVLIGGSMGTASYVLAGLPTSEARSFSSACHGAGRSMSRHAALKHWRGRQLVDELASRGILVRSPSLRGIAEEAPGAYKDVDAVVMCAERSGLAKRVARLTPVVCIKG
ncbi:MAG TPA: RtcB family protein [Gammaproteobacteria bacterium]|nr:RtcB family protein [Gammaproteobacteria bacterium]